MAEIVLVDQDGPLANFEKGFFDKWREKFPNEPFVRVEDRKSFYLTDDYPPGLKEKIQSIYYGKNFILDLLPVEGSVEALKEMVWLGLSVVICTSPLSGYENCVLEKYLWVERYFGRDFTNRIVFSKDKTIIRGRFLIDDRPEMGGIQKPEWEHIVFDCPYNKNSKSKRLLNWRDWRKVLNF